MASAPSMILRRGEDVTWRSRSIGARDGTTGHAAITYTDTTIKVLVERLPSREFQTSAGGAVDEKIRVYTTSAIQYKDRIVYHSETYEVTTEPISHWKAYFYEVDAVKVS